jgi:ATP-dependent RNA helicase DDX5/DBP2
MFSATWPPEVQSMANSYCSESPIHVNIGSLLVTANHMITQNIILSSETEDKYALFVDTLNAINDESRMIIFCNTKAKVDELTRLLKLDGWKGVIGLHGSKD